MRNAVCVSLSREEQTRIGELLSTAWISVTGIKTSRPQNGVKAMTDRIPPEPPENALVVIYLESEDRKPPAVIGTYTRDDKRAIGFRGYRRWHPLESAPDMAPWTWEKIWSSAQLPDLRIYVATGFTNLWSYNGMEPPK